MIEVDLNRRFLAVAQDPAIIPAVHHSCDEWCDYCPVTQRCLAFRCTIEFRKVRKQRDGDLTFASLGDAVTFTRELSAIEGRSTEELDALISHPPGASAIRTADPLESLAWQYAVRVATARVAAAPIPNVSRRQAAPEPGEVVAWYQLRIYMREFARWSAGNGPVLDRSAARTMGWVRLRSRSFPFNARARRWSRCGPRRTSV